MNLDLKNNLSSSIVVFLVALPLCMGVALASGGSVLQGILAGVIGGVVVGAMSGSNISVSGPAAGLIVIVESTFTGLEKIDPVNYLMYFALVVFLSGVIQIALGLLKLGNVADFIPVSVIKGMLAAIGIILILKQVPHLVGYDKDAMGELEFIQKDGHNTFSELYFALQRITPLAIIIGLLGLFIQVIYELPKIKSIKWLQFLPAPLLVVIVGVILNQWALNSFTDWAIKGSHMVNVNVFSEEGDLVETLYGFWTWSGFPFVGFDGLGISLVWKMAFIFAIIGSIESLLSLEAGDKIDPLKRNSPPNRELIAQGVGNVFAGLFGALPVTSVIVRTSANANSGATNKTSTILHGLWLFIFVLFAPKLINLIPLSALASVLIYVGYKLARPTLFKEQYQRGKNAFIPFVITILAILLSDLLVGITIGLVTGFYFVLKTNYVEAISDVSDNGAHLIRFHAQTSFLNKALLKRKLYDIPMGDSVILDFSNNHFIDNDITDLIGDFCEHAERSNIEVEMRFHDDVQQLKIQNKL